MSYWSTEMDLNSIFGELLKYSSKLLNTLYLIFAKNSLVKFANALRPAVFLLMLLLFHLLICEKFSCARASMILLFAAPKIVSSIPKMALVVAKNRVLSTKYYVNVANFTSEKLVGLWGSG